MGKYINNHFVVKSYGKQNVRYTAYLIRETTFLELLGHEKLFFCYSGTAAFVFRPRFKCFIQKWCPYFCQIYLASDTTESFLILARICWYIQSIYVSAICFCVVSYHSRKWSNMTRICTIQRR